jgi:hypothetical protein
MRTLGGRTLALPTTLPHLEVRHKRGLVLLAVLAAAVLVGRNPSWLLAIAVWGFVTVFILLRRPWFGIPVLMLASAFFWKSIGTGTGSSINIAMIGVAGLGAVWIVRMILEDDMRLRPSIANAPWILMCVVAAVSIVAGAALWNPWVVTQSNFLLVQGGQLSIYVLSAMAFFLGANFIRTRLELQRIAWILVGLGILLAIHITSSLTAYFTDVFTWVTPMARVWVTAVALGLGLFYTKPPRWARVALSGLALYVTLQPLIFGQGWASGWLPSLIAVFVIAFLWLWIEHGKVVIPVTIALVFGVVILGVAIVSATDLDRWSFDTRIMAWSGLLGMMGDRWLFGLGLASYWHYWKGVYGVASYLDPTTGYQHFTYDPQVNMHNNYADIFGQMGLAGALAFTLLAGSLFLLVLRAVRAEGPGFGRAYAVACMGGLAGTLFAGLLGDWILPFVYNVGLAGFRDSYLPWLLLGGIVVLNVTRESEAAEPVAEAEFESAAATHPSPLPAVSVAGIRSVEVDPARRQY